MNDFETKAQRLYELLADEQLNQLAHEDQLELAQLREELDLDEPNIIGEAIVAMDEQRLKESKEDSLPEQWKESISRTGQSLVSSNNNPASYKLQDHKKTRTWRLTTAAAVVLMGVSIGLTIRSESIHKDAEQSWSQQLAQAQSEQESLTTMLAQAMQSLDEANFTIAQYTIPSDPSELLASRRKLLSVPDTIQIAWQPFNQPDSLAEQGGVQGDVIWNDELQEGYLRFVGLEVNDPDVEQYQVWVIDERGLEQRVSGGVFNASNDGEVIVPITPGIDLGRVALFAITIEDPGGTWVSDLQRRVVVAPRAES